MRDHNKDLTMALRLLADINDGDPDESLERVDGDVARSLFQHRGDITGQPVIVHGAFQEARLDALDVHFRQLLDEGEDRIQFALQVRNLGIGDRDPRKMRDAANSGGVDGHI